MYLDYFGLHERPFSITPDPRYLFMSERHAEALAHLIYGVTESDGFIVLTGEVGTGKTTLVRSLLQRMPEEADVALVLNPQLTALEFLTVILKELGVELPEDRTSCRALTEALNRYLVDAHSRGRRTIAVVDEAQNLSAEVLEQIRLLTNLETTRHKLLQIVLIGQPELRELLAREDLRQLAQRITARYHLLPLNQAESVRYIEHRLSVAGALQPVFTASGLRRVHRLSGGIPRLMNLIADRALLGAWSREQRQVDHRLVDAAAREVFGSEPVPTGRAERGGQRGLAIAAAVLTVVGLAVTATALLWPEPAPTRVVLRDAAEAVPATSPDTEPATVPAAAADRAPSVATPQRRLETPARDEAPSLDAWLREHQDRTGTADAFDALFGAWKLPPPAGERRCEAAAAAGLRCAADQAALAELLLMDRPAIIALRDFDGGSHQVLLAAHRDGELLLEAGDARIVVPRRALNEYWFGEYLLLWKPATIDARSLLPGMRGEGVRWLRQSLTALSGERIPQRNGDDVFDAALADRVRDYQRSRRLAVDGLVGQKTQMMINSDLGVTGIPRLSDAWPETRSVATAELR